MKQFGTILKFELKGYLKNKVFVGITLFLVIVLKLSRAVTGSSTNAVIAALSRLSPVTPAFFSFPGKIFRNG